MPPSRHAIGWRAALLRLRARRALHASRSTVEPAGSPSLLSLGRSWLRALRPTSHPFPAGMHHICIEVPDVTAAIAELKGKGIRVLSDEPKIGAHNKPVVFLHPKDCGGVLTELEEE